VEQVSWGDVQAALSAFNQHLPAGATAALPTEAQWEYAARAGTVTAFNLGDTLRDDQANLGGRTCPVKQYAPNAWGLYDCHGQVFEWCDDGMRDYSKTAIAGETLLNPRGGAGPGGDRDVRGGSWIDNAQLARSAYRTAFGPGNRLFHLGFRLVLCLSLRSTSPAQDPEGRPGPGTGPRPPAAGVGSPGLFPAGRRAEKKVNPP
jgi:formylglycine-generating enzyme required for sulfatase activity